MITCVLAFVACLGTSCRTVEIPWEGSLMTCSLFAQQQMAAWEAEHPGWVHGPKYRCTAEREA